MNEAERQIICFKCPNGGQDGKRIEPAPIKCLKSDRLLSDHYQSGECPENRYAVADLTIKGTLSDGIDITQPSVGTTTARVGVVAMRLAECMACPNRVLSITQEVKTSPNSSDRGPKTVTVTAQPDKPGFCSLSGAIILQKIMQKEEGCPDHPPRWLPEQQLDVQENKPQITEQFAARAVKLVSIIPDLRRVARKHGYALCVHGSMLRDLDLIAIPFARKISECKVLAEAIRAAVEKLIGIAYWDMDLFHLEGCPGKKLHGRLVWSIYIFVGGAGPYIDLSIMPGQQYGDENEQQNGDPSSDSK